MKMKNLQSKQKKSGFCRRGFTLMEVLAVVLIIGILSSVALPQYRKVVEKGKFTKAQVMAKAMYDSCERLVSEWGADSYGGLKNLNSYSSAAYNAGLSRLDIGGADDLPVGFSVSGKVLTGAGFEYTLNDNCGVSITKKEGNYRASFTFDGTGFTCAPVDNEACAVYGLD